MCGLEVGWATGGLGVEAVQREVLVVAATHGGLEALDGRSLVAQSAGLAGGDLSAVELALGLGVDEEQLSWFSRARERGVGPVAGEVLGAPDHARPLDGGALDGVRGQHVGVLEVLGHVRRHRGGVGRHRRCARARPSRSGRRRSPCRACRCRPPARGRCDARRPDHPPRTRSHAMWMLSPSRPSRSQLGADERVEALAALVVTHDQHRLPPRACGLALAPRGDRCALTGACALESPSMTCSCPRLSFSVM